MHDPSQPPYILLLWYYSTIRTYVRMYVYVYVRVRVRVRVHVRVRALDTRYIFSLQAAFPLPRKNGLCSCVSQRGDSPFVYRDGTGWPASLPYIRKIYVSVALGTQSGIRLHKRVYTYGQNMGVLKK